MLLRTYALFIYELGGNNIAMQCNKKKKNLNYIKEHIYSSNTQNSNNNKYINELVEE
jgi:hypothetical protein